jgi:hypothetical protein
MTIKSIDTLRQIGNYKGDVVILSDIDKVYINDSKVKTINCKEYISNLIPYKDNVNDVRYYRNIKGTINDILIDKDYDCILYLDSDVIINKDINYLFDECISTDKIIVQNDATKVDTYLTTTTTNGKEVLNDEQFEYLKGKGFCSGIIMFPKSKFHVIDKWNKKNLDESFSKSDQGNLHWVIANFKLLDNISYIDAHPFTGKDEDKSFIHYWWRHEDLFIDRYNYLISCKNNISDLTLCVLASVSKEKYEKRLKEYLDSYGIKAGKRLFNIVLLVDQEEKPDYIPEHIEWFNSPGLPVSLRFTNFLINREIKSRWVMQVDDDSCTDIDKTVELLDQFYDFTDSMILMGGRNTDCETSLQHVITKMGTKNILYTNNISEFEKIPYFVHAWEPSILSKKAIEKLKCYNGINKFFDICKETKPVFGDQVPYVLCKLARVPIVECSFLSPFELIHEYSGLNRNGRFSHIHYFTDKMPNFDIYKKLLKNDILFESAKEVKDYIVSNNNNDIKKSENAVMWRFGHENVTYGILKLETSGKISNYNNNNEVFWEETNEFLDLLNVDKKITTRFHKPLSNKNYGDFLNGDVWVKNWHWLERI